jgi:drug/metabolite transporter (DMT)-like permease
VREPVRRRLWYGLALALAGLSLVVELWSGVSTLDGEGVAACLAASVAYAGYVLLAERSLAQGGSVLALLAGGFVCATVFWSIVEPWSGFPASSLTEQVSLLGRIAPVELPLWSLLAAILALGTFVPFVLMIGALHHLPATHVTVMGMLEPVVASVVAFAWLRESLTPAQIAGGVLVLGGVALAQTARARA